MKSPALILAALVLPGCWESQRQEQVVRVEKRQGIEAGKPTDLVITSQEQTQAEVKAGYDPQVLAKLVQESVKAVVPGAEVIASMIPKPKDPEPFKMFGLDPETVMGLAGAAWGGERVVAATLKRNRLKTQSKA